MSYYNLPVGVPPARVEVHADIRAAAADYLKWTAAASEASTELDRLQRSREDTLEGDARALAKAKATGGKDPGPRLEAARLAAVADADRHHRAARHLQTDALGRIQELAREHHDSEAARIAAGLDDDRGELAQFADEVEAVLVRMADRNALTRWLKWMRARETRGQWPSGGVERGPVDALRGLAEPPPPPPEPASYAGPLLSVPARGRG